MAEKRQGTVAVNEVYTDDETTEALDFIREYKLPMSELKYALKYVRILHVAAGTNEQLVDTEQPSDMDNVPMVEPPPYVWNEYYTMDPVRIALNSPQYMCDDKENQPID